jgi:uncharacterized protein YprB with RNaseH-like and TPR domain
LRREAPAKSASDALRETSAPKASEALERELGVDANVAACATPTHAPSASDASTSDASTSDAGLREQHTDDAAAPAASAAHAPTLEPRKAADPTSHHELPAWWKSRAQRSLQAAPLAPAGQRTLGAPAELREAHTPRGAFAVREARLPLEQRHGLETLARVLDVRAELFLLLTGDERLLEFDPRRALFLDIETTGLSGGAGTKSFLVGLGWIEEREFVLWQGFLRGPEEEAALLHEVAERIESAQALVTFFGKTFDRHRLEDKMRVHGVRPPFKERAHLDLYHPLRALYRPALADARLATLERVLCGLVREDDLSGAYAPEAWYDFLAGRPHRLERVFAHNRDDVLSLATLCAHLGGIELAPAAAVSSAAPTQQLEWARLRGLARALAQRKRWRECAEVAQAARALAADEHAPELEALVERALRRSRSRRG